MITAITLTGDRVDSFAHLEKCMDAQTVKPTQWIVVDDGTEQTICTRGQQYIRSRSKNNMARSLEIAIRAAEHDHIVFMEDDDHYGPQYIQHQHEQLKSHILVGQVPSIYYHVPTHRSKTIQFEGYTTLAQTAIRGKHRIIPLIHHAPFIDVHLFRAYDHHLYTAHDHIGCKGVPGRKGLGLGHQPDETWDHKPIHEITNNPDIHRHFPWV